MEDNTVTLQRVNISGQRFEMSETTWLRLVRSVPEHFHHQLKRTSSEIFVERHPTAFQCILYYHQGGQLHIPADLCPSSFKAELQFWGISDACLAKCCFTKYTGFFDDESMLKILEEDDESRKNNVAHLQEMSRSRGWTSAQGGMWLVLTAPSSSVIAKVRNCVFFCFMIFVGTTPSLWLVHADLSCSLLAKIYFVVSTLVILASLFALIAGTHHDFQRDLTVNEWEEYFGSEWSKYRHHFTGSASPTGTAEPESNPEPEITSSAEPEVHEPIPIPENAFVRYFFLDVMEYSFMAFFTADLLVRYIFCPYRLKLLVSFFHWVDVFSLLVMYLKYIVEEFSPKLKYEVSVLNIIHCLQVVRVFRLFRIVQHTTGFRVLIFSFKASIWDMLLMSMFLLAAVLLFSTFAYFSGDDTFPNIPESFWWVIVTMTTVGYGDVVPKILLSKIIGAFCAISGVCLLSIIIPIFVNNFMLFYAYSKIWGRNNNPAEKHANGIKVWPTEQLIDEAS